MKAPFEKFSVGINGYSKEDVIIGVEVKADGSSIPACQSVRDFIEDAIREKLARVAGSGG